MSLHTGALILLARIPLTLQGQSLGTLLILIDIDLLLSLIYLDFTFCMRR